MTRPPLRTEDDYRRIPVPEAGKNGVVAVYRYPDADGVVDHGAYRTSYAKALPWIVDIEYPGWAIERGSNRKILYCYPDVLDALGEQEEIHICEGEKDVDTLRSLGFAATCNRGGAGKWDEEYSRVLAGAARITIWEDNDKAGRDHARAVAESLSHKGMPIRIVQFPELPEKGDVTDWINSLREGGHV